MITNVPAMSRTRAIAAEYRSNVKLSMECRWTQLERLSSRGI
jgi:hypothetical protein